MKAYRYKEALEDADACLSLNEKFDQGKLLVGTITVAFKCFVLQWILIVGISSQLPGYLRKAGALIGLQQYSYALKVCEVP